MRTKISAYILSVLILTSLLTLCARGVVVPCNLNIESATSSLTISGINSKSYALLKVKTTTNLKIQIELQKLKNSSYETIAKWQKETSGTILVVEEKRIINALSDYRIKVTFTAGNETIVKYAYPQ